MAVIAAWPAAAQRGGKSARDLFYAEAGLIVAPAEGRKGKFGGAKKSTIAVTLGLKYRLWKLQGEKPVEWDSGGPWAVGDHARLGIEINDTGYLYVVHRQASGAWRRLFPTPEIERGSHFVRSGVVYPLPPEEGLELTLPGGAERFLVVLAREPVRELESLVGPLAAENTVSAAPPPEISEGVVEKTRSLFPSKDLLIERVAGEKTVYVVNRTGRAESGVAVEIRLGR